jgi:hypothetical protein
MKKPTKAAQVQQEILRNLDKELLLAAVEMDLIGQVIKDSNICKSPLGPLDLSSLSKKAGIQLKNGTTVYSIILNLAYLMPLGVELWENSNMKFTRSYVGGSMRYTFSFPEKNLRP